VAAAILASSFFAGIATITILHERGRLRVFRANAFVEDGLKGSSLSAARRRS
jgi:hypothetical protein